MSGSSQNAQQSQNSSTTNSLPSWLTGAFQNSLGNASNLYGSELGGTQGQSLSNLTSGLSNIGNTNPQSIGTADTTLTNMLNGGYNQNATSAYNAANPALTSEASGSLMNVNSNPYLQGSYNQALQGIQNNVDSQFGAAGRNVLAGAPVQADQASTLANQLYGGQYATNLGATQNAQNLVSGNYNTGVGQIGSAAATSPSVTQGLYTQGNQLLNSGNTANNLQSWYQGLLGQSAAPFGQSSSVGSGSSGQQYNPSTLSTIGQIIGML
jgi:hypothetical protein